MIRVSFVSFEFSFGCCTQMSFFYLWFLLAISRKWLLLLWFSSPRLKLSVRWLLQASPVNIQLPPDFRDACYGLKVHEVNKTEDENAHHKVLWSEEHPDEVGEPVALLVHQAGVGVHVNLYNRQLSSSSFIITIIFRFM